MAKEIQQVKNYQVNQTLVESARNKALMDELAIVRSRKEEFFSNQTNQYNMIRQEEKLLGKEILDVKKHQMNTVTMVQRQLKEWTRNSSARECYSVWAHQQANPNLVEMPVHKVTKQIYDNANNNRPMFYGFLKSDLPPSETTLPPPKSKDPHDARKMKKGSLRGKERSFEAILPRVPRIGVEAGTYACFSMSKPCLGIP
ncbi:hypothetical protein PIB30_068436 [Stylosanthes scabra]|uniref:Uncharacterized protein n=1 Tax=Stylosanthes scabra TaxID=79078 RepID=A0ABU6YN85_9FABA|nr:hypothetical protein [Stylosanthes scabra]